MKNQKSDIEQKSDIYKNLHLNPKYKKMLMSLLVLITCIVICWVNGEKTVSIAKRTEDWWPTFKYDSISGKYKSQLDHSIEKFNQEPKSQRKTIDIKDYCKVQIQEENHHLIKQYGQKKGHTLYNLLLVITNKSPVTQELHRIKLTIGNQGYKPTGDIYDSPLIYQSLYKNYLLYTEIENELDPGEQVKCWVSFQLPTKLMNKDKELEVQFIKTIKPIKMAI